MTTEQRLERIETDLAATTATLRVQAESVNQLTGSVSQLTVSISQLTGSVSQLAEVVSHYIDGADARMKRIEENLDGLIRAITAEHTNGR
jgi:septal ring factor EnvC (AmiA/AmiB activator)